MITAPGRAVEAGRGPGVTASLAPSSNADGNDRLVDVQRQEERVASIAATRPEVELRLIKWIVGTGIAVAAAVAGILPPLRL